MLVEVGDRVYAGSTYGTVEVLQVAEHDTIIQARTENGFEFWTDRSLVYRLDTE